MARELSLLERRYHAGGRVSVEHPTDHHDHHANALALAALVAMRTRPSERNEEDLRPDGSGYVDEVEHAEQLATLKQRAIERGIDPLGSRRWRRKWGPIALPTISSSRRRRFVVGCGARCCSRPTSRDWRRRGVTGLVKRLTSQTDTAMVNEAMCEVLCHNLVVLVHEMHELEIEPGFWAEASA